MFREAEISHFQFLNLFNMAKASVVARSKKRPKYSSRIVRRCFRCGRKRGYMRDFNLCRICFREMATNQQIPGVKKASW
jgi:small subunit ribosomal protein S14